MAKMGPKKVTELEKNLAKKVEKLTEEIRRLPAHVRRKKDAKEWKDFFTAVMIISVIGLCFCGAFGWLAVALLPTLSTLIFVESGLFASLAIGFSAWPLYSTYLWIRNLFTSDKVKRQDKEYDQCHQNLMKLKILAAEKNNLSKKISSKLDEAVKCISSTFSFQEKACFDRLSLSQQIRRLERARRHHPALSRKIMDQCRWNKIFQYSSITSSTGVVLYAIACLAGAGAVSAPVFVLPFFAVPVSIIILFLIIAGPVTMNSLLYGAYLRLRDLYIPAEVKLENKQYTQLVKAINELDTLASAQRKLDEKINSQFPPDECSTYPTDEQQGKTEKRTEPTERKTYVYTLFQPSTASANEAVSVDEITFKLSNT